MADAHPARRLAAPDGRTLATWGEPLPPHAAMVARAKELAAELGHAVRLEWWDAAWRPAGRWRCYVEVQGTQPTGAEA